MFELFKNVKKVVAIGAIATLLPAGMAMAAPSAQEVFDKYKEKKDMKKLAVTYDYFIAQATIMPKIATTFGKVFSASRAAGRGKRRGPLFAGEARVAFRLAWHRLSYGAQRSS